MALRAVALFLGGFTLVNLAGELRAPGFDASVWWIDLRPLPAWAGRGILLPGALLLVWFAARPEGCAWRRRATATFVLVLAAASAANAARFWVLLGLGRIEAGFPIPFSLLVLAAWLPVLARLGSGGAAEDRASYRRDLGLWRSEEAMATTQNPGDRGAGSGDGRERGEAAPGPDPIPERGSGSANRAAPGRLRSVLAFSATLGCCAISFPLAQMFCFGKTDYRRPADAIVVFGARAYADGTPSQALADRVRTGCALWREGLAPLLVLSGGPGDGAVHETEAMRRLAVSEGVPDAAILLDPEGTATAATVRNTRALLARRGARRLLAVSHFYHLPRIKMSYQRDAAAAGVSLEAFTVPAVESRTLSAMPWFLLREVACLWVYHLRPLAP